MKMSKTREGLDKKSQTNRALEADINRKKEREVMNNSCNCFGKYSLKETYYVRKRFIPQSFLC